MNQLELFLTYECDHKCVFCSAESIMKRRVGFSLREVLEVLGRYRKLGYNFVNFTGGEPLLFDNIALVVEYAKKIGFRTYLATNANNFSRVNKQDAILKNLDQICVSLHGKDEKAQYKLTGNKKSFERAHEALKGIEESPYSPSVIVNTVVCSDNLESASSVIETLEPYSKVFQLLISNVAPEGAALDDYRSKTIRLADAGPLADHVVSKYSGRYRIRFFGFPLCALGKQKVYSNDLSYDPRLTVELVQEKGRAVLSETIMRAPVYMRTKPEKCEACEYRAICGGVFERYLDEFGDEEITVLTKSK